jgi:membrane protease YdiL (CAAX protease family)
VVTAIRDLLTGPPAYRFQSPWPPFPALLVGTLIVVASLGMASGVTALVHAASLDGGLGRSDAMWIAALWLVTFQVALIVLVLVAVAFRKVSPVEALALARPPSARLVLAGLAVMVLVMLPYNVVVVTLAREQVADDLRAFTAPLHSEVAILFALIIAVGAPLSEELLFRGFLLGALAQSRLGFAGAALVSTLAWTALHAGYSSLGLIEVYVAGLIFSWLLWRTGNLWVPIICHGIYNSAMLWIVWLLPFAR